MRGLRRQRARRGRDRVGARWHRRRSAQHHVRSRGPTRSARQRPAQLGLVARPLGHREAARPGAAPPLPGRSRLEADRVPRQRAARRERERRDPRALAARRGTLRRAGQRHTRTPCAARARQDQIPCAARRACAGPEGTPACARGRRGFRAHARGRSARRGQARHHLVVALGPAAGRPERGATQCEGGGQGQLGPHVRAGAGHQHGRARARFLGQEQHAHCREDGQARAHVPFAGLQVADAARPLLRLVPLPARTLALGVQPTRLQGALRRQERVHPAKFTGTRSADRRHAAGRAGPLCAARAECLRGRAPFRRRRPRSPHAGCVGAFSVQASTGRRLDAGHEDCAGTGATRARADRPGLVVRPRGHERRQHRPGDCRLPRRARPGFRRRARRGHAQCADRCARRTPCHGPHIGTCCTTQGIDHHAGKLPRRQAVDLPRTNPVHVGGGVLPQGGRGPERGRRARLCPWPAQWLQAAEEPARRHRHRRPVRAWPHR